MSEELQEIVIGCDVCYYVQDENYTYIHDEEKELCLSLPYRATEREIESACRGYARGLVDGRCEGQKMKEREIRESLGLK
jgi:hypothetical protein